MQATKTLPLDDAVKEIAILEQKEQDELREIAKMIMDIRRRTGFGRVEIIFKYGEVYDMSVTINRRKSAERKQQNEA